MAGPAPWQVELARRIIEQEAAGSSEPAASAAAVEAACRRLADHLVGLLGSGGVTALLTRALHLAKLEQPLLAGVAVGGEPAECFSGLAGALAASTDEAATAAAASVLAHALGLLVTLLGEELGMKPIRKLWPQAISGREIDG
jgi:hypothetical protein